MTGIVETIQAQLAALERRVYSLEHPPVPTSEPTIDLAQQDIMQPQPARMPDSPLEKNFRAPAQYSYATAHVAFPKLKAVVGTKLSPSNWEMWHRLVMAHGWRCLIKAAENIDPIKRWPDAVEQLIKERPLEYANV